MKKNLLVFKPHLAICHDNKLTEPMSKKNSLRPGNLHPFYRSKERNCAHFMCTIYWENEGR